MLRYKGRTPIRCVSLEEVNTHRIPVYLRESINHSSCWKSSWSAVALHNKIINQNREISNYNNIDVCLGALSDPNPNGRTQIKDQATTTVEGNLNEQ